MKYGTTVRVVGGFYEGQLGDIFRCAQPSAYQLKLADGVVTDWIAEYLLLPEKTDKKDK